MGKLGEEAASRRKRVHTTLRADEARPPQDLIGRNLVADGPDQLWVAASPIVQLDYEMTSMLARSRVIFLW